ncbi:uncharacterized protein LOC132278608 [Cornus florida]|uniref:uncharacterized protein LOC132278608 n=1 Tax=Cornus florida TaxID=4283 RepID=UPI0028A14D3F|nr:uncharacterized protein LOC132278608 [Cornus florida]
MGSLMAGWDSHVSDPKTVKFQRNLSLTKGEIEAYWKQKKNSEEEHLKVDYDLPYDNRQRVIKEAEVKIERSSSLPPTKTKETFMDNEPEKSLEDLIKQRSWWGRTTSAFLNEPPVIGSEGRPTYKYASQFHVANVGGFKATSPQ